MLKRKLTNKNQMEKLVQLMENNPNIARGLYKKSQIQSQWEKHAEVLNSLGPPTRSAEKWLKVWTDLKSNTKKKLIHNQKELKATGGGPNQLQTFTVLEEAIIDLTNLRDCVVPPGKDFGICNAEGILELSTDCTNKNDVDDDDCDGFVLETPITATQTSTPLHQVKGKRRFQKRSELNSMQQRVVLLERQTQNMETFHADLKNNICDLKNILQELKNEATETKNELKELINLKKEKLRIYKEEVKETQNYRELKLTVI